MIGRQQNIDDETMDLLLQQAKTYLNITWEEYRTDEQLKMFIRSSLSALRGIYGHDIILDTTKDEAGEADFLAHDLLLDRVFYMREKALDDFKSNFQGELNSLYYMGKVRSAIEAKEQGGTEDDANEQ